MHKTGGLGENNPDGAVTAGFVRLFNHGGHRHKRDYSRISTERTIDGSNHTYTISGAICATSNEACTDQYADTVFAYVNRNDVPFSNDDLGSGNKLLFPNQPIYHSEDIASRISVNITLKGHRFYPGQVLHSVNFRDGNLYYDIVGTGSGGLARFNNDLGIGLFRPSVLKTVERFGL